MSAATLFSDAVAALERAGVGSARLDARLLLAHALAVPATTPVSSMKDPDEAQRRAFAAFTARRAAREPLAYIVGHKEFWSLDFAVGPGVLVPRPESETLIEALLSIAPARKASLDILDLGTGCACLLIAALSEYPLARGTGVDSSSAALRWASRNVERHRLAARCLLVEANWATASLRQYDVVLVNPPYINSFDIPALAPEVARYEPRTALDGGIDGLEAYRCLAPRIGSMLKPDGGVVVAEIGTGQAESVPGILSAAGVNTVRIVPDLGGIPRCVVARSRVAAP